MLNVATRESITNALGSNVGEVRLVTKGELAQLSLVLAIELV